MQLKVIHKAENEEISKERANLYISKWPIVKQLEALTEAYRGDENKINELIRDFEKIRKALPYTNS